MKGIKHKTASDQRLLTSNLKQSLDFYDQVKQEANRFEDQRKALVEIINKASMQLFYKEKD